MIRSPSRLLKVKDQSHQNHQFNLIVLLQGFRHQKRAEEPPRQDEEQEAAGVLLQGEPERREAAEVQGRWATQRDERPKRRCRNPKTVRVQGRGLEEGAEPKQRSKSEFQAGTTGANSDSGR